MNYNQSTPGNSIMTRESFYVYFNRRKLKIA